MEKKIDNILNFLLRPSDIAADDTWPIANVRDLEYRLIPTVSNFSKTTIRSVKVLSNDFCNYELNVESVGHISFFCWNH